MNSLYGWQNSMWGSGLGIKDSVKETLDNALDVEWVDLILAARNMGITVDNVRAFISKHWALCNDEDYL